MYQYDKYLLILDHHQKRFFVSPRVSACQPPSFLQEHEWIFHGPQKVEQSYGGKQQYHEEVKQHKPHLLLHLSFHQYIA